MASVWYAKSANAPLSNPGYEWRTRAALLAGNWPMVRWSIEQMPPSLRNDPAWIYWHARALKQSGDTLQAKFKKLEGSSGSDLALAELKAKMGLGPAPEQPALPEAKTDGGKS